MTPPYSLEQAKHLQSRYKGCIGAAFEESRTVLIDDIAVVPFEQASRQRFLLYYMVVGKKAQEQILQEYKGLLFDVLIIARNERGELIYRDLCSYFSAARHPELSCESEEAGILS